MLVRCGQWLATIAQGPAEHSSAYLESLKEDKQMSTLGDPSSFDGKPLSRAASLLVGLWRQEEGTNIICLVPRPWTHTSLQVEISAG